MSRTGSERADAGRVVVTGIGLITALGAGRQATWAGLRAGQAAVRGIVLGGESYAGFPLPRGLGPSLGEEPVLGLAERAAAEALSDAGLRPQLAQRPRLHGVEPERVATLIGLSKGGLRSLARVAEAIRDREDVYDLVGLPWALLSWPSAGARHVAATFDLRGPCSAPVAACATGLVAVLQGAELIRRGACDVALAGAADASLEPWVLAAFRRMRALARVEPGSDPSASVRPLDRNRSGFLVGEGAAVLVLERADHARARGAAIHAEVAGGALGSDAYHLTDLNPDPSNLAQLIGLALENSGTDATEIDHVNLHGTATRPNDPLESQAVRAALGPRADEVLCTANKAQIGHLLGAAGAAELALTCLALRDGLIPPTLNRNDPDPACPLATSPVSHPRPIRAALKLSLGFGGHLAVAVLRRPGSS